MIKSNAMTSFLPRVLGMIPLNLRRIIIGRPDRPSRIATVVHNLVNALAPQSSETFPCHGPLQGFRMSTDWARYRGYIYGNWEPIATQAILSYAKRGMCAFDIGAHLGYYSLLLAKCVGSVGRVVSFEASPQNFSTLQRNISANNLNNVELVNLAVFSNCGTIGMSVSLEGTSSGDWSICRKVKGDSIQVQTISLDQFCEVNQVLPDFLKIDVEGAEYDVLIGGRETIGRSRPTMLIELHHFDGDLGANRVPDLLSKWNYRIQWLETWPQTSHILAQPSLLQPHDSQQH
jgi:FkbM family methyltransferase